MIIHGNVFIWKVPKSLEDYDIISIMRDEVISDNVRNILINVTSKDITDTCGHTPHLHEIVGFRLDVNYRKLNDHGPKLLPILRPC